MAWSLESLLALATMIVVAGPLFVLAKAYARTHNRRVLLAVAGLAVFFVTEIIVLVDQVGFTPDFNETEIVEFVGDIAMAVCFAAAFLTPAKGEA